MILSASKVTSAVGFSLKALFKSTLSVPPLSMIIFFGSKRIVPGVPWFAVTSTKPRKIKFCFPDTSTKPPLPPKLPPVALIFPWNRVVSSAQALALPAFPFSKAFTEIEELLFTKVWAALGKVPCPWKLPPINTFPPVLLPLALILASTKATFSPNTATVPAALFETSILPETIVTPVSVGT